MPAAVGEVLQNGAVICSGNLLWEEGNALETLQKWQILVRVPRSGGVHGSGAPALLWRLRIESGVQLYLNFLS